MAMLEFPADRSVSPLLDRVGVENARLVRAARDRLLTEHPSVTVAMLAEARGASENATRQWLLRRRRANRIITVEHRGEVLVPSFQFDEAYEPLGPVADTLPALVDAGMGPWASWRWFVVHNPWIGEPPAAAVGRGDEPALRRALDGLLDA